ncbi:DcuS/MalK family sensor histidine kinase [Salibacterium halotolerans]|uniref:histidine kinase n=1 Tax=Salibacterium halotolerans TaxID=1884432 RepID=A0A1I5LFN3_9BACI|nr:DcuS/MalK family sensor histidine kinase [Salibacterium halotolerans]SFO95993.1 two-component system, CitB family, sensor histidine kinase MalK [Salibacterium halotolerans]
MIHNRKRWNTLQLQTWITLLVSLVLVTAFCITGLLIGRETAAQARQVQVEETMDIAHAVAHTDVVQQGLQNGNKNGSIQRYTESVQQDTGVAYIVVMNMDHIRRSHPVESRIGQYFVGNDEDRAFQGETYTSTAEGTLGESLRSFVPIRNREGGQIGVVSVGILTDNVQEVIMDRQKMVYIGSGAGLLVGLLGAYLLARRIKKTMHGMEPREIAHLLKEREAMLSSVREGIAAVNTDGEIVIVNEAARDLFTRAGLTEDPVSRPAASFLPELGLQQVLEHQQAEYDREMVLGGYAFIVNRMPVLAENQIAGAVATFREKTELTSLAEQLTGARYYAETLRAQTHEFMNKLHVISAMIYTESYSELQDYIHHISNSYQQEVGDVSRLVKDPVLAGFLLNKTNAAREEGMEVELYGDEPLPVLRHTERMDALITIIGNLFDNAVEAVQGQNNRWIRITINHIDGIFYFTIRDNGKGMTPAEKESLLRPGFSTKGMERGHGTVLIQKSLQTLNGEMEWFSQKEEGTVVEVTIPYEGGEI